MMALSLENRDQLESQAHLFRRDSGVRVASSNSPYSLLDRAALPPMPGPRKPKSPDMVSPQHAWRRLCASTGCEVTLRTFYNWIGDGRLYTVRMGRRIFVPVSALEMLIENCLRGESL